MSFAMDIFVFIKNMISNRTEPHYAKIILPFLHNIYFS
ncbi:hypothetical protein SPAR54_1106 [Streptococcus pneumoniae GA18523]|nr:hypothetical protein SPAR54_1106 [Streptococcus pneumoniae GA18523]EHE15587.1 hypothetical protein SPAR58_1541 [Streptococcus pneumoniae GA19451]